MLIILYAILMLGWVGFDWVGLILFLDLDLQDIIAISSNMQPGKVQWN